jgi:hypothetical protein
VDQVSCCCRRFHSLKALWCWAEDLACCAGPVDPRGERRSFLFVCAAVLAACSPGLPRLTHNRKAMIRNVYLCCCALSTSQAFTVPFMPQANSHTATARSLQGPSMGLRRKGPQQLQEQGKGLLDEACKGAGSAGGLFPSSDPASPDGSRGGPRLGSVGRTRAVPAQQTERAKEGGSDDSGETK